MIRVESLGSIWVIDEGAGRYCRFPKTEAGRERPEWGNEDAGTLQDAVWHEFATWRIVDELPWPYDVRVPELQFYDANGKSMALAPNARLLTTKTN